MSLMQDVPAARPRARIKQPYLERLVINVNHDCNLRCAYCYADTGAYEAPRMRLTEDVGQSIVDDFYSRFAHIEAIQLFGGEPMLNYRVVETLCEHVLEVCEREGSAPPRFTMVSNGTILNDAIVEMIRRFDIAVTISLDGLGAVNDSQRVYANGRGSFERVAANIRTLKQRTGQPMQIEGTFTARHLELGFTLPEFMSFIARELDVHFLHMPWIVGDAYKGTGVAPSEENIAAVIRTYCEGVEHSLQSLLTPDLADTILISAAERALKVELSGAAPGRREHLCPAGSGTLSVGADGKIFPCFMFTNKDGFQFGAVGDGAELDEDFNLLRRSFVDRLAIPDDEPDETYDTGSACAGQNFEVTGEIDGVSAANQRIHTEVEAYLRERIAALKADEDAWQWIQVKLMLHQLEKGGEFEAPEC